MSSGRTPQHESYTNPPVVEVIAEVQFQSSDDKASWSGESGQKFIRSVVPGTETIENLQEIRAEFSPEGGTLGPPNVIRVRARSSTGDMAVQVGNGFLACHWIKTTGAYEFTKLPEAISTALPAYREHFTPGPISCLALTYVDIVEIPGAEVDLDEYFSIGVNVPSPIQGTSKLSRFDVQVVIDLGGTGSRKLEIRNQDLRPAREMARFRLDWRLSEQPVEAHDVNNVISWLEQGRSELYDWFGLALTEKCRELFR